MTILLEIRERIKKFYGKYDIYVNPLIKFIAAFISFLLINQNVGFMDRINNILLLLLLALMCSFLPQNMIVIFSGLLIVIHFYAVSMELAIITLIFMILMYLLYYIFSPKDSYIVLLTPITFLFGIPYVMPLVMGLIGTPISAIPVIFGTIMYYMVVYVKNNTAALAAEEPAEILEQLSYIVNEILGNKTMLYMVIAFTAAIIVVYIIRRLSIDYAWSVAIVAGALTNFLILLIGDLILDISYPIVSLILGMIVSMIIAVVLQFFIFNVDYTRTEHVQFEDDEYYYYVKAVPKMIVTTSDKKIQRIYQRRYQKNNKTGKDKTEE